MTPLEPWLAVQDFLAAGGDVLWLIAAVTLLMWTLILERLWYLRTEHRRLLEHTARVWRARQDHVSWHARQIRRRLISQVAAGLRRSLATIKTLVALCPLLGLLGTVTGMIEVFEVMALTGSGNPRAMASGVSKATIPTMAGMVAALSGLYLSVRLERAAEEQTSHAEGLLVEG